MNDPVKRFFRILVIGGDSGKAARIIEDELRFSVTSVAVGEAVQVIQTGAGLGVGLGATVVTRAAVVAAVTAREKRGQRIVSPGGNGRAGGRLPWHS